MKAPKKFLCVALCLVFLACAAGGCEKKGTESSRTSSGQTSSQTSSEAPAGPSVIGLLQYDEHPSFDAAREAFMSRLEEWAYDENQVQIDYQNAGGDKSKAESICKSFADSGAAMIVAFSDPGAKAAVNAAKGTDTAVLYVGAQTGDSVEGQNVAGVQSATSLGDVLDLMLKTDPDLKTVGVLYDGGDESSQEAAAAVKKLCGEKNLQIEEAAVSKAEDLITSAKGLTAKVDAVITPAGKLAGSRAPELSKIFREAKLPWYGDSEALVQAGALAAVCSDFEEMGRTAADMAVQLMAGRTVEDVSVSAPAAQMICINQTTLDVLQTAFPQEVLDAAYFYAGSAASAPAA